MYLDSVPLGHALEVVVYGLHIADDENGLGQLCYAGHLGTWRGGERRGERWRGRLGS